jgi:threonine synthase
MNHPVTASLRQPYSGLIDHYRSRLALPPDVLPVALCEGRTPLVRLHQVVKKMAADIELYVKLEGSNPTGSFKDRGMTMAVTMANHAGNNAIICASTGNTSASAAAYAARARMRCFVLIPQGKIALGKLAQAMMHGAKVIQIDDNFDRALDLVRVLPERAPVAIVNSINPYRLQGQKTAAFEIVDELSRAPDYHAVPVGNAGNITAYWMGYSEYAEDGIIEKTPTMLGYQAEGAAPFLSGKPVAHPETVATAIRIGNPASWQGAVDATTQSGGWFRALSDAKILSAQKMLAKCEGLFVEPASAASLAGIIEDARDGRIAAGSTVVCVATGHGLKDPDTAISMSEPAVSVAADLDKIAAIVCGD